MCPEQSHRPCISPGVIRAATLLDKFTSTFWAEGLEDFCLSWFVTCFVDQCHCITKTHRNQIHSNQINTRHPNTRGKRVVFEFHHATGDSDWICPHTWPQHTWYKQALDTQDPDYHCPALFQDMWLHCVPPNCVFTEKNSLQLRWFSVLVHSCKSSAWNIDMHFVYS